MRGQAAGKAGLHAHAAQLDLAAFSNGDVPGEGSVGASGELAEKDRRRSERHALGPCIEPGRDEKGRRPLALVPEPHFDAKAGELVEVRMHLRRLQHQSIAAAEMRDRGRRANPPDRQHDADQGHDRRRLVHVDETDEYHHDESRQGEDHLALWHEAQRRREQIFHTGARPRAVHFRENALHAFLLPLSGAYFLVRRRCRRHAMRQHMVGKRLDVVRDDVGTLLHKRVALGEADQLQSASGAGADFEQ